jgi:hypothetical protein
VKLVRTQVHAECGEVGRCPECGECAACLSADAKCVAELKEAGRELYDAWNADLLYVNKMFRLGRALVALGVELRKPAEVRDSTHPSQEKKT